MSQMLMLSHFYALSIFFYQQGIHILIDLMGWLIKIKSHSNLYCNDIHTGFSVIDNMLYIATIKNKSHFNFYS